jgi:CMP-N-acetylneuraminic acid synthetase
MPNKALRIIFGIPLIVYGIYRMLDSYEKIKKSFFSKDDDEE